MTQLAELTALGVRIVFVNKAVASNLAFIRSVEALREAGVRVLLGPGEFEPHAPRTGDVALERYPWALALKSTHD